MLTIIDSNIHNISLTPVVVFTIIDSIIHNISLTPVVVYTTVSLT